jgi:hypothetical protein
VKRLGLWVTLALGLSACTHSLHLSHTSDFSPTYASYPRGSWVSADAEQFTIMGFVTQTNYVDEAFGKLSSQCAGGQVQGIQTQYSTAHGFFSWTNRVRMQGLCVKDKG